MNRFKGYISGFLGVFSLLVNAQHSVEYDQYKNAYPNAHYVRLNTETKIDIEITDNDIDITQYNLEEDLYLDAAATFGSKRSISYSTFYSLHDIEASSFFYENGNYKEVKVKDFRKKDEITDSFHDDVESVNFIYPNLRSGSKSRLAYTQKIKNPRFLSAFYFGDYAPVIRNKVTITANVGVVLEFRAFHTEGLNIDFKKKKKGKKIIYSWELKNTDSYDTNEDNAPGHRKIFPHIIPMIKQYKIKDRVVKVSGDVAALYNWYYDLVKDINKTEKDEELVAVVRELTAGKDSDLEKVKAIYYWVQKNIKYIAFEYALGGFIPREANDVYKKKYGDCKDNSSILSQMLEIAGLKGYLTWIGTRSIPYSYEEVPTPAVDNHMILTWFDGEKPYFLDATGRFLSLEATSSFIQGKEALIGMNAENFIIKKVPVMPASHNIFTDSTVVKIKDRAISGKGRAEISGYKKIDFFNRLELKNSEEDIKDFYTGRLSKGSNKFLIGELKETNKYNYDKNLLVDYSFTIDDYVSRVNDEIYIDLNLNKMLSDLKTEENRKSDIEYKYKRLHKYVTVIEIPEGHTLTYLPENVSVSNDLFSASIQYKATADKIIYEHIVKTDFLTLNAAAQKELNTLIKKIEKQYKEVIVLKKQT